MWFNKYYRCPCGTEWQDEWDCLCNDRCPTCDTECEPYDHVEIDLNSEDKAIQDAIMYGKGVVQVTETDLRSIPFIMLIRKDSYDVKMSPDVPGSSNALDSSDRLSSSSDDTG